jgi:hypothetical protein
MRDQAGLSGRSTSLDRPLRQDAGETVKSPLMTQERQRKDHVHADTRKLIFVDGPELLYDF